ncbi:hypothetical protein Pcinc_003215 [Petrolisthes cinctipes]|uniref:Uncharacterized protein n=1 Tax=Petrolisthes cinctipes TaxID=88211 RepID=A0AAE1GI56_PETCI|nr:hypothetical protein Pcinc_003215 [Petrolisthes cinctipes]
MENLESSNKDMMQFTDGEMQLPLTNNDTSSVNSRNSSDFLDAQAEELGHEFNYPVVGDLSSDNKGEGLEKTLTESGSGNSNSSTSTMGTEYNSCTTSPKLERGVTSSSPKYKSDSISNSPELKSISTGNSSECECINAHVSPELERDVVELPGQEKNGTDLSLPERVDKEMSIPESVISSQADIMSGSVSMSANIADKLSQMRVSRESLEGEYKGDYEDLRADNKNEVPPLDTEASVGPPRKLSERSSLRQVFPYISCLPFENNMVFCFVLSVWDNIVGPQTVYVWKRKAFTTQKTIEVFDDPGDVEVGEDSVRVDDQGSQQRQNPGSQSSGNPSSQLHSKNLERQSSKDSVHHQKRPGSNFNSLGRKQAKKCETGSKNISVGKPRDGRVRNLSSFETFCEDFGNNILKDSLNAIKAVTTSTHVQPLSLPTQQKNTSVSDKKQKLVPKLSLPHTNTTTVGELEDQGGGVQGWWYGRGKLRVGGVAWYVTEHSVGVGQVGPASDKVTSTLHVVPHQGIVILAARFTVEEEEEGATPYCLSMVVPVEEYNTFLPLCQTVTSWLLNIAATARLLLTKHGLEGGGFIKGKLVELCDVLVALRSASLDQYPLTPAARPPDDRRFAEVALTSHLQTRGASVVVADSPNAANKMIMWLAQFSDPSTLHASRLCLSYSQWPFHPGLYLQGIVRNSSGEVNLTARKLLQSYHPITVIDVGWGTVKQTGTPDLHAKRNASALRQELLSLWHDLPDVSVPSESLLEPVRGVAPLVKKFLHDYDRLGSCESEVRQGFITAFLRSLHYIALALITWTQHQWCGEQRRSGQGSLRRALCSVFDLDERDLRVVLARAEFLQPGFYSYVSSMSQ